MFSDYKDFRGQTIDNMLGRGGGIADSVLAFFSEDLSSNPATEKMKIDEKEAGVARRGRNLSEWPIIPIIIPIICLIEMRHN